MKWKEDTNKDKQDPREATTGIREERDPSENQGIGFQQKRGQ